jgi:hypothetical protein
MLVEYAGDEDGGQEDREEDLRQESGQEEGQLTHLGAGARSPGGGRALAVPGG